MNPILLKFPEQNPYLNDINNIVTFKAVVNSFKYLLENTQRLTVKNGDYVGMKLKDIVNSQLFSTLGEGGKQSKIFFENVGKSIDFSEIEKKEAQTDELTIYPFGIVQSLAQQDGVCAYHLDFDGKTGLLEEESFMIIYLLNGVCMLSDFDSSSRLKTGEIIYIPKNTRIELMGEGNMIILHN